MNGRDETIGKIVYDLMKKEPATKDPIEIQREAHKDYEETVYDTLEKGKKAFPGDFYLAVLTTKERILKRVIRNRFVLRLSCPTPEYDQTAYRYNKADDMVEFLWVIPSKEACWYLKEFALDVVPEERALRDFSIAFLDGSLLKLSKKLNNEKDDSNILVGREPAIKI